MKLPADLVARLAGQYQGRSVCVTGGAGFIGSHVVDVLMSVGANIVIIDDLSNSAPDHLADLIELEPQRVRFVHGSILDDDALDQATTGCEVLMHLAAVGSVPLSVAEPQRPFSVNSTGTVRVLQAALRNGLKRVVNASSSSVYGDGNSPSINPAPASAAVPATGQTSPKVETQLPCPLSPYAASKVAGEAAVRAWSHSYGLSAVSLRFFNVFGPRQRSDSAYAAVIPAWARNLLAGKAPVIFGDGQQSRDFTPVANAVIAVLLAGSSGKTLNGQAVNVGTGKRTTLIDLCTMMVEAFGTPQLQPVFQVPRTGDVRHSLADITLAKQLIDYTPVVGLADGVKETVQYFRRVVADAAS